MLRWKPSELTLTPDDVDETLRRMARRPPSRPPARPGQRRARTSGCPAAPRLVPGPQRFVGDAITDLGNIPTLRPQPQRAVVAHVDDELEDSEELAIETRCYIESLPEPVQSTQSPPASSAAASPPAHHNTRSPLRFGHSRARPEVSQSPSSTMELSDESEGTLVEPAHPPIETVNFVAPDTPGCRRTPESAASSPPTYQPDPPETPASLRGGAGQLRRSRVRSVGQDVLHSHSPLRHLQTFGPSCQTGDDGIDEEHQMVRLQGNFAYRKDSRVEIPSFKGIDAEITTTKDRRNECDYTFRRLVPRTPQTEPFRRTSQPRLHSRSHSSNEAVPSRLFTPLPNVTCKSAEDVFWTASAPVADHQDDRRMNGRPRQHSSEVSTASLAYSYYELPDHRQSSGEHSTQGSLTHSRIDGTVAPRQASRGTYRSIRLSEAQACGDNVLSSPTSEESSFASPVLASPAPMETYPHTRTHPTTTAHRRTSHSDESLDLYPAAITAALENRVSPLEALTAHIGRASQRLSNQRGGQSGREYSVHHTASPEASAFGLRPFAYEPPSSILVVPRASFGSSWTMGDDPYTRGVSAHSSRPHISNARPVSALPSPGPEDTRSARGGRSSQRSSENALASSLDQGAHTGRISQVQDQVSAFERIHTIAASRDTRLRTGRPQLARDNELAGSPMLAAPLRIPPRRGSRRHAALSPGHGNARRRSVRMDPRLHNQENSGEAEIEMMRQELESVRVRYDEDCQGDVIHETPPRIGRVERHM